MTTKLYIHIVKRRPEEFEISAISEDKITWYQIPEEFLNLNYHTKLMEMKLIKNAMKAIKPILGYRRLGINLDEELKEEYFDEYDNPTFKDMPLEESGTPTAQITTPNEVEKLLFKKITELEEKLNTQTRLQDVENKFLIKKFNKNQKPEDWILEYENECVKHNLNTETIKIEALRFFVEGSAKDWYEINLKKIGLVNWEEWKNSFLSIFADPTWIRFRKAYNYKYLGGSLVDYTLTKEKLFIDADNIMKGQALISMIVMGLPTEIQDKLNPEEVTTVEKLITKLKQIEVPHKIHREDNSKKVSTIDSKPRRIEMPYNPQKVSTRNDTITNNRKSFNNLTTQKKPCFICETLGWPNRFHPPDVCRNKHVFIKKENHLNEADIVDSQDMIKISMDNEDLNGEARGS